jgi:hypothetical protein
MRVPAYEVQVTKKYGSGMSDTRTVLVDDHTRTTNWPKLKRLKEQIAQDKKSAPEIRARAEALFKQSTSLGTLGDTEIGKKLMKRKYASCHKKEVVAILKQGYQDEYGNIQFVYDTAEKVCTVLAKTIIEMNITDFKWFLKRYLAIRGTPFVIPEKLRLMFEKSKIVKRPVANLQGTLFKTRKCSVELSGGNKCTQ